MKVELSERAGWTGQVKIRKSLSFDGTVLDGQKIWQVAKLPTQLIYWRVAGSSISIQFLYIF